MRFRVVAGSEDVFITSDPEDLRRLVSRGVAIQVESRSADETVIRIAYAPRSALTRSARSA